MIDCTFVRGRGRCGGAILLLAMVFMLLLAILATTVLRGASLQLHMAGNHQFQEDALQRVLAVGEELSHQPGNFLLRGDVGFTNCPADSQRDDCDVKQLQAPRAAQVPAGIQLDYRVVRQGPRYISGSALRESQQTVSSARHFQAAVFEIDISVDGSAQRLGNARLVRGVALRIEEQAREVE